MTADSLQEVNEKEFVDLHSRCQVSLLCRLMSLDSEATAVSRSGLFKP